MQPAVLTRQQLNEEDRIHMLTHYLFQKHEQRTDNYAVIQQNDNVLSAEFCYKIGHDLHTPAFLVFTLFFLENASTLAQNHSVFVNQRTHRTIEPFHTFISAPCCRLLQHFLQASCSLAVLKQWKHSIITV